MLDRWLWLKARLPKTLNGERLIDIGCGSGAFTIGAARRGYLALGLSWDDRNQRVAADRSALCHTTGASFSVQDVRGLGKRSDFRAAFDVALCLETIEHIIDDRKLVRDICETLKPGGLLLLTTPFYAYKAITKGDDGPFMTEETGWHVRRGYTAAALRELCADAGLMVEEIGFCSGPISRYVTWVWRKLYVMSLPLAWALILPLRILPPILDPLLMAISPRKSGFSICLQAQKPRFAESNPASGMETG